jgi:YesN/AraC family two-component response regulator
MAEKTDYTKRRFLIVDDEVFMLGLLERILKQFNAGGIVKAADGAGALRAIRDDLTQVDCIISDFNMKPVNGLQLLQAIRTGVNPRIPRDQGFIMLTGHGETEVVKTAVMLDVSGYLVKPVAPNKLVESLDRSFTKPLQVKGTDYYKAIDVNAATRFNDAESKRPGAWVILPRKSALRGNSSLEQKIAKFKTENATRDGLEEVKIKNARQCDLTEAKENMILAEDIEAEEGAILLRKGTTLSKSMISRLRELAVETKSRNYIWIGELA